MEIQKFSADEVKKAANEIKKGGLVAFPTETVYGLGANALNPQAVKQVYQVKGRPSDNPLIVHVTGFEQVKAFIAKSHPLAESLVHHFWPGPLTLILPIKPDAFDAVVTGGLNTVAFRMPNQPLTLELIAEAGVPLVGPSANLSGRPSPTTADHVIHDFQTTIAGVLDGGPTQIGVESTVLDLSDETKPPMILRPGAITKDMLEQVCQSTILIDQHLVSEEEAPKAPGMKYKHYAPTIPVQMVSEHQWEEVATFLATHPLRAGILAGPTASGKVRGEAAAVYMYANDSIEAATRGLFSGLRALDESQGGLDILYVASYPEEGLGVAYMNRLKKAANHMYFTNNKSENS
ncbi:L-threonylcarbamoyladenylate synthase [Enterococcus camelliae]|uniref:Threonylcarbamoyl-AMP synthase n=1 Tax=Enterococcus camelliae TaxID=453959 RepID=A0ABW5TJA9_9ENTE